ncbi:hypothetical protein GALL_309040 [mine drainage metagenome]|uniref:Uncharacterized protein n=1 Tax=mine drainage metagenome TaxID=410659 RepID=A0A1J5QUU2_9ZZZZ
MVDAFVLAAEKAAMRHVIVEQRDCIVAGEIDAGLKPQAGKDAGTKPTIAALRTRDRVLVQRPIMQGQAEKPIHKPFR